MAEIVHIETNKGWGSRYFSRPDKTQIFFLKMTVIPLNFSHNLISPPPIKF